MCWVLGPLSFALFIVRFLCLYVKKGNKSKVQEENNKLLQDEGQASIALWPLMQLWPQHMFGAPRIKQTSLRPRSTACWFTCVRCRGPRMAAMHTHHAVPTSEGGPWAGKEEGRKDWPLLTPSCVHYSSIQTNPTPIPQVPLYKLHISCFIRQKSAYWLQEALGSESKINENLIVWASYTDLKV